jgi:hypothetical protein
MERRPLAKTRSELLATRKAKFLEESEEVRKSLDELSKKGTKWLERDHALNLRPDYFKPAEPPYQKIKVAAEERDVRHESLLRGKRLDDRPLDPGLTYVQNPPSATRTEVLTKWKLRNVPAFEAGLDEKEARMQAHRDTIYARLSPVKHPISRNDFSSQTRSKMLAMRKSTFHSEAALAAQHLGSAHDTLVVSLPSACPSSIYLIPVT